MRPRVAFGVATLLWLFLFWGHLSVLKPGGYFRKQTENDSSVIKRLRTTLSSVEFTAFSEWKLKGGLLIASTEKLHANHSLILVYYVHERKALFSLVLEKLKQQKGLSDVAIVVSIDHHEKAVVEEYAALVLRILDRLRVYVFWHFAEKITRNVGFTSTPLTRSLCTLQYGSVARCIQKVERMVLDEGRDAWYTMKRKYALSAHVWWLINSKYTNHFCEHDGNVIFLEEDHIFSRNDALKIFTQMQNTKISKIVGGMSIGRYINEDMEQAELDWAYLYKQFAANKALTTATLNDYVNAVKFLQKNRAVSLYVSPAFSNTGWVANRAWVEQAVTLRNESFFVDWDWQFHKLGESNKLKGLYLRPNVSLLSNIGDCFGDGLHTALTNVHFFLTRCLSVFDVIYNDKIFGGEHFIEAARQISVTAQRFTATSPNFINEDRFALMLLRYLTKCVWPCKSEQIEQKKKWDYSNVDLTWKLDTSSLPGWMPYNRNLWKEFINHSRHNVLTNAKRPSQKLYKSSPRGPEPN